jgi:hypothetical protein
MCPPLAAKGGSKTGASKKMTYLLEITEYIYLFGVSLMTKCATDVKGNRRCISERKRARRENQGWLS